MNASRKLYRCHCLFNICCISKHYNESFKEIGTRVSEYCSKIYQSMIKKGMCKCSHCKPRRYRMGGLWLLRQNVSFDEKQVENIYVVCRDYYESKINQMYIDEFHQMAMRGTCQAKMYFEKHKGKFPCCYNYYLTGLISIINICTQCKIFLVSLSDFQLKKIVTAKKICL